MKRRTESYESLDELLDPLAEDIETFSARAAELAARWNAEGVDLDLPTPEALRRPVAGARLGRGRPPFTLPGGGGGVRVAIAPPTSDPLTVSAPYRRRSV